VDRLYWFRQAASLMVVAESGVQLPRIHAAPAWVRTSNVRWWCCSGPGRIF